MYSGIEYRILIFIVFQTTVVLYVLRYAGKVKKDPKKSILYGEERTLIVPFKQEEAVITLRQKICLILFVFTIAMLLYGTTKLGWYINEIAAMYLMMMIITGIVAGYSTDGFSNMFWPTACAVECGLMGIPINKWYKFIAPLFLIMVILQIIFAAVSVLVYV